MKVNIKQLEIKGDERGFLVALESFKNIPFEIKRIYYIFGTLNGVSRGFHAHKELDQMAVCVRGKCQFLLDDGNSKSSVWLDSANLLLHIPKMVWHEMHNFTEDCVLLVLASDYYNENDYIREYEDFKKAV